MPALNKLTSLQVKNALPGKYSDGGGLWLHKKSGDSGNWFLRVHVYGRRREMGLGAMSLVSLSEARSEAAKWRAVARQGRDPIKEREKLRRQASTMSYTLENVAIETFSARKAELKEDGKAGRWFSPLELHVLPRLGQMPIEEIDQQDIKNTLAPIWHTKGETAKKAMNRLGIVFRYGAAMGLDVDLQATMKAKALLGKSRQVRKHISALPWTEVPDFYDSLSDETVTNIAFRLLILTAVRSRSLRFMHLDELHEDTWIIPAVRMKTNKEFHVPLSTEAQSLIEQSMMFEKGGFLFPSVRKGVISDATMSRLMERRGMNSRPHGFRSSFRTWCAEATETPREVAEMALAHETGNKVERAYRRTDFLEQRRVLMERWAKYVSGKDVQLGGRNK
ncbi:tyrosine-type recombinase/integrase [Falsihalocynthiibacter sp. SS001]|uniref:tyrosine-type recombinase/integrase n=1 Tax=Falsihalocynthiibacter sp. SS001 TaxID=3349698 RepID=UPI0036D356DF